MSIELISTLTPSGSTARLTFSTIPQTFDDLMVIGSCKALTASWDPGNGANYTIINNNNASGDYDMTNFYNSGTTSQYSNVSDYYIDTYIVPGNLNSDDGGGAFWMYYAGYTNTTKINFQGLGGVVSNGTNASSECRYIIGQSDEVGPITQLDFNAQANFNTDGKISLYGITNA
jgi:hypothetical protein